MIYYISVIIAVLSIVMVVILLRRKQILSLIVNSLVNSLSIYCLYMYIDANIFNEPCGGAPDCMNETGLWIVLSLLIMGFSLLIFLVSVFINSVLKAS